MSGSNSGPLRWKPPSTAYSGWPPVSQRAYRQMLTTPAWPQPVSTTSPLSRTLMMIAWSSSTSGSGCQRPFSQACCGGKPGS